MRLMNRKLLPKKMFGFNKKKKKKNALQYFTQFLGFGLYNFIFLILVNSCLLNASSKPF